MITTALLLQAALWLVVSICFWRSSKASIYHPISFYLVFHGIVFVVRPLFVHYADFDLVWRYIGFYPTDGQFVQALAISSVGLLVFIGSCWLASRNSRKLFLAKLNLQFDQNESLALYLMLAILAPIIIYSLIVTAKGIEVERAGSVFIMTGVSGYAYDAQHILIPLLALLLVRTRFNNFTIAAVIGYFGYRALIGWGRWTIILTSICYILIYCWSHRRTKLPSFVFAIIPVAYLVFAILGPNRELVKDYLMNGRTSQPTLLEKGVTWREKYDTLDFASFDFLTYIAAIVPKETKTYNYGIDYLQVFTEPIPRALWKDKPLGAPLLFDLNDYGNFIGLTYSLPGNGWMDGGWLGVIITCFLWGFCLGRFYKWFTWREHSIECALTYLVAIAMIFQLYRDGNVSIFHFWLFTLPPIVMWRVIADALGGKWWREPRKARGIYIRQSERIS